ncbi:MAG TPA: polyamine aminopropyltransferase [Polyangiaceae bacterium]|nr:polyamine aminopropyltransferase [Polyangiaceae bacterium]
MSDSSSADSSPKPALLFGMVLAIATSGLVYELGMAAVGSYLLGDTVNQFSLVIGVYLSALGAGAYLSRFIDRRLALTFIDVELATALVGGLSAPVLLAAFGSIGAWEPFFYATVAAVGILVGLELPLLIRALAHRLELKELIAKALTFDYAGALLGSLSFSLFLLPELGLSRGSIASGLINALVGLASTWALSGIASDDARGLVQARLRAVAVIAILLFAWFQSDRASALSDSALQQGRIVHAEQSRYQRIVVSENAGDVRLFLNGHLQFSSRDEVRYHEALVHPALRLAAERKRVFIGGGGDGLAAREVLRWPDVERVTLVDLDPAMTRLFRTDPRLSSLNEGSLANPKLRVENDDAMRYLRATRERFDVIILDFPDPTNYAIGKLYSLELYRILRERLAERGVAVVQATSPLFARPAFWCIVKTLQAAGLATLPYHAFVPAFGEWGFVLAAGEKLTPPLELGPIQARFLTPERLAALFVFPPDSAALSVRVNRVDNQALVAYYGAAWDRWN